jgi:hypothetical protein
VTIERLVPPGSNTDLLMSSHLPAPDYVRGFLVPETPGYDSLVTPLQPIPDEAFRFSPSHAYSHYLKMHKVLVGRQGAVQLETIHDQLSGEWLPRYLSAAGSAAVEAALVRTDHSEQQRLALVDKGVVCWHRAIAVQRAFNAEGQEHVIEHSAPHRLALNIAVVPLLRGLITETIPEAVNKAVFHDCLNIAQANLIQNSLLAAAGDVSGAADHLGLGYELNALLSFNRRYATGRRFMVPAFDRSDSGHHHSRQTHDLVELTHRRGRILMATPVEIKSTAGLRQRQRYGALLVRGKMHLSAPNQCAPRPTLEAIAACYEGTATRSQRRTSHTITEQLVSMIRDYQAGDVLADVVHSRNGTGFRDKTLVVQNYPGLAA